MKQRETNPPAYKETVAAVAESNVATPDTGRNHTNVVGQFDDAQPVESCVEISVEADTVVPIVIQHVDTEMPRDIQACGQMSTVEVVEAVEVVEVTMHHQRRR